MTGFGISLLIQLTLAQHGFELSHTVQAWVIQGATEFLT